MKLQEAQAILRDETESCSSKIQAGWTIADSPESSLENLLECLSYRGQIAEAAAIALYKRTNRPRASEELSTFVVSPEDWRNYLQGIGAM